MALVSGPLVLLAPSLGRPVSDLDHLADALRDDGFEPRGVDLCAVTGAGTLHDYADHVIADALGQADDARSVHLVGHAFGNRVVRCTAADHPDKVATVTCLAAGGLHPGDDEAHRALLRCFGGPPVDEIRAAAATAFFAPGHDPAPFLRDWDAAAAQRQGQAVRATDRDDWWSGGEAPLLVVQGLQDRIAPPTNGRDLLDRHPDRVELVEIDGAGHALLPVQPAAVASAVLDFLHRH
jgi:pimeloyl-ACP methyl ester carboxylesterase